MIRHAVNDDAEQISRIYNHYISNTVVTFEEEEVTSDDIFQRMQKVCNANLPWLVAVDKGEVVGYAYASPWHVRSAFKYTVEVTVYLSPHVVAKGWGTKLYSALFAKLQAEKVHVAIGVISLPNESSVGLHEKFSMQKVGYLEEVGYKFGQWLDIGYWRLIFD